MQNVIIRAGIVLYFLVSMIITVSAANIHVGSLEIHPIESISQTY